jgi:hypothetical protein
MIVHLQVIKIHQIRIRNIHSIKKNKLLFLKKKKIKLLTINFNKSKKRKLIMELQTKKI